MKPILLWIAALVLVGSIFCLAWKPVLLAIGDVLVVQDDLCPADVVHVISGPNYRVDYGIYLYQRGYGKQLFFTGRGRQAYDNQGGPSARACRRKRFLRMGPG